MNNEDLILQEVGALIWIAGKLDKKESSTIIIKNILSNVEARVYKLIEKLDEAKQLKVLEPLSEGDNLIQLLENNPNLNDEISQLFDLGFKCDTPNSFDNPNEIQKILAAFVSDKSKKALIDFIEQATKEGAKKTFDAFRIGDIDRLTKESYTLKKGMNFSNNKNSMIK